MSNDGKIEKTCPRCGKVLPISNENGGHNFCPSSKPITGEHGRQSMEIICMGCKMEELTSARNKK